MWYQVCVVLLIIIVGSKEIYLTMDRDIQAARNVISIYAI